MNTLKALIVTGGSDDSSSYLHSLSICCFTLISQDPLLYMSLHIFHQDNKKLSSFICLVDYFQSGIGVGIPGISKHHILTWQECRELVAIVFALQISSEDSH